MTITYMETKNNPIIADTSALVSLIVPSDVNHAEAVREATRLVSTDRLIILPSEVLAETVNILGKKFGHGVATQAGRKFLDFDGQFSVTLTDADELRFALDLLEKEKQSVSLTDCVVMA